jgi:hypothetical protein
MNTNPKNQEPHLNDLFEKIKDISDAQYTTSVKLSLAVPMLSAFVGFFKDNTSEEYALKAMDDLLSIIAEKYREFSNEQIKSKISEIPESLFTDDGVSREEAENKALEQNGGIIHEAAASLRMDILTAMAGEN